MARRVAYHEDFFRDLNAIYDFIAADSPHAAYAVALAVTDCLDEIEATPEIGLRLSFQSLTSERLRQKTVRPYRRYSVIYRLDENELRFLYIHHGSRSLGRRLSQERRR